MTQHVFSPRDTEVRVNAIESVVRSLLATLDSDQAKKFTDNLDATWNGVLSRAPDQLKQQLEVTRDAALDISAVARMHSR